MEISMHQPLEKLVEKVHLFSEKGVKTVYK